MPLLQGLVLILLGVLAILLSFPGWSQYPSAWSGPTLPVVLTIGSVLVTGGIIRIVDLYLISKGDRLFYLEGVLQLSYVLSGALLLTYSDGGMLAVTLILAAYFAVDGTVKIQQSLTRELRSNSDICKLINEVLSLIRCAIFVDFVPIPATFFWAFGLLIGVGLIVDGCCGISTRASASP